MPKSKRSKVYHLSKTKKKGRSVKDKIVEEVRSAAENYERCFVFHTINMRNNGLKGLRKKWADSRIFMGKNKVMALALGRSEAEEHRDGLSAVSQHLAGACGLLFTNEEEKDVVNHMEQVDEVHYARSGFVATEDFMLEEGEVPLPFSMETQLRKYGLHTILKEGKILLNADTQVCNKGDTLTPEQCKLLEIFQIKMASFKIYPVCLWEAEEGTSKEFDPPAYVAEMAEAAESNGGWVGGFMED